MLTRARFIATAASGLALALGLGGCSFLGIEDPTADDESDSSEELPANSVDFDSLIVSIDADTATWAWSQIQNTASANNGLLVCGIPLTARNDDTRNRVLNGQYLDVIAPDGTAQPDITGSYPDDVLKTGGIPAGSSVTGTLHVLFRGSGTYTIALDNLLGSKAELAVSIDSSTTGMRAIPDAMGALDVADAVPAGAAFDVRGLTLTLSADTTAYCWLQASAPGDPTWDGRWCVGVPVVAANHSGSAVGVTQDVYEKFGPSLDRQDDPAPCFTAGSYVDASGVAGTSDLATCGLVGAGQSIEAMVWWPYDYDGDYYVIYDSDGAKVIACAHIAQYE